MNTTSGEAIDAELLKQVKAIFPNPYEPERHYPCPVTINGITRRFSGLKTAKGVIFLFLHKREENGADGVMRIRIAKNGKMETLQPISTLPMALKWPGLSGAMTWHEDVYAELISKITHE